MFGENNSQITCENISALQAVSTAASLMAALSLAPLLIR